jgi:hypothetical protein
MQVEAGLLRVGDVVREGPEAPRVVAAGRLDLRDERAGIREQLRGVGPGDAL